MRRDADAIGETPSRRLAVASVDGLVVCHSDVLVVPAPELLLDVGSCHTYRVSAEQLSSVEHHPIEDIVGFEAKGLTNLVPLRERIRDPKERSNKYSFRLVVLN